MLLMMLGYTLSRQVSGVNCLCEVQLPANSSMAVSIRAKAEAEEQERAEMKRLVLQAHQQNDFDYVPVPKVKQTMLSSSGHPVQTGSPKAGNRQRSGPQPRAPRGRGG